MRLIAERLGVDPAPVVAAIAVHDDAYIVAGLAGAATVYADMCVEARRQLIAEVGDPAPYRLA